MTQLAMSGVAVEFGATTLLQNVSFVVGAGDRWGIVGRNGTGKTTLLRLITGDLVPTSGTVSRRPGLRIALLEQFREFTGADTVWEAAAGPFADLLTLERSLGEQAERLGALGEGATAADLDRYARDLELFERRGGYAVAPRVDAVLHGLGFEPEAARTQPLEQLSGGERGRLGLVRQLVAPADVLLLDEPTNHLDLETTAWLERFLRESDATSLVISHDRAFLESVVDHVLCVEDGTAIPYTGRYSSFVAQRAERRLAQQRQFEQQRRVIAREEDYIRRNIAGQNSRQAKGRRTRLARLPRLGPPATADGAMALRLAAAERGGDQVVVAERVRLAVSDRVLLQDFSAVVRRGDVIGLIGSNGSGKSTLLRAIAGESEPAMGELRLGSGVQPAHFRQDLSQVPATGSLLDAIADLRPLWGRGAILSHLARFGFTGDMVERGAATLSGGERARLALAMIVLARANLLLLDEPTNHLDVESIEALEDAIEAYDGTVILVSHDRALLRALTTRVWVLHEGRITDVDAGFEEWEQVSAARERALAAESEQDEERRRVRERERVARAHARRQADDAGRRAARRAVEAAEAEVQRLDARAAALAAALEDPALYAAPEGRRRAAELGSELEAVKRELEAAFARWEAAEREA